MSSSAVDITDRTATKWRSQSPESKDKLVAGGLKMSEFEIERSLVMIHQELRLIHTCSPATLSREQLDKATEIIPYRPKKQTDTVAISYLKSLGRFIFWMIRRLFWIYVLVLAGVGAITVTFGLGVFGLSRLDWKVTRPYGGYTFTQNAGGGNFGWMTEPETRTMETLTASRLKIDTTNFVSTSTLAV